jgi:hypothetical protein
MYPPLTQLETRRLWLEEQLRLLRELQATKEPRRRRALLAALRRPTPSPI